MKAIIGTGQLGLAILDGLLTANPHEEILLVNRSGKLTKTPPANVQVMAANATNPHEMACIAADAEMIYSCTDVPYPLWKDFYPAMASALVYALNKSNAKLVYADNLYAYGNVAGAILTESLPGNAQTKKGKIRAAVVDTLLHSGEACSDRVAIVKAADFIGPRIHKGVFGTDFLERLYNGKPVYLFGDPELPHTFTYIRDFAQALINVSHAPDAFGQVWHAPNAPAISAKAWVSLFETGSGKIATVKNLPKVLVRLAGIFHTLVREMYELAYQFEYPYLVSHDKYAARFGHHYTPHETVVRETLDWYQSSRQK